MYASLLDDIKGAASLPTYEIDRTILAAKGKHVRPFDPKTGFKGRPTGSAPATLSIDAKLLMLASAKTELARTFDFAVSAEQAVGMWIRLKPLLIVDGGPLRLTPTPLFARKDASAAFDSSRVGEGIGHLFMAGRGYVYWDHLPTLLNAVTHGQVVTHAERTRVAKVLKPVAGAYPGEQPDFVCEKQTGDVALLECKGSFVKTGDRYSADTSVLRAALDQLKAWATLLTPAPTKQFAVGAFVRHDGDTGHEPSMVAWVDPPGEPSASDFLPRLPPDAIRRGHYGAALALMGFIGEGRDLRLRARRSPRQQPVLTVTIKKDKFVVTPFAPFAPFYSAMRYRYYWDEFLQFLPGTVLGLQASLFQSFASALSEPNASLEAAVGPETAASRSVEGDGVSGRILADGQFVGEITDLGLLRREVISI